MSSGTRAVSIGLVGIGNAGASLLVDGLVRLGLADRTEDAVDRRRTIVRLSKADIAVWAATFALTVLADLTVAVEVGVILAALLYIYRISQTTTVAPVTEEYIRDGRSHVLQDKLVPWYVAILRIHGPFLFGTTEKLVEATSDLGADGIGVRHAQSGCQSRRHHFLCDDCTPRKSRQGSRTPFRHGVFA